MSFVIFKKFFLLKIILNIIFPFFISYIYGSIPFSVIIGNFRGINPLLKGSKSSGATNSFRISLNFSFAFLVFFLDFLKGFISFFLNSLILYNLIVLNNYSTISRFIFDFKSILILIFGGIVIVGHCYSFLINFRGGKGISTTIGFFLIFFPRIIIAGVFIWLVIFLLFRYSSLSSLFFIFFIFFMIILNNFFFKKKSKIELFFFIILTLILLFIIVQHKKNIYLLLKGKEFCFSK
jgi:glycerol-3-phosphate acyltransferase PlsY